jgi:hypothetical protein
LEKDLADNKESDKKDHEDLTVALKETKESLKELNVLSQNMVKVETKLEVLQNLVDKK